MYKLSLNQEEFFLFRRLLESAKVGVLARTTFSDRVVCGDLLTKLTFAQIETQEEAERELQSERYAQNLHSMPEGS